jgi:hypothetical protein
VIVKKQAQYIAVGEKINLTGYKRLPEGANIKAARTVSRIEGIEPKWPMTVAIWLGSIGPIVLPAEMHVETV